MEHGKETLAAATILAMLLMTTASSAYVSYDVIVVRGDIPADYIIASIYAATEKIPLVFVNPDMIQDQIKKELSGYRGSGYQMLLIIGGENAISGNVEDYLKDMGFIVNRLWDWNRYGTAARVAIDLWTESDEVVISDGEDYSTFLVAQQIALEKGAPILFISNSTIPDETKNAIKNLGAKSAVVVSSDPKSIMAVESLGINAEAIETTLQARAENDNKETSIDFYAILLISLISLVAIAVIIKFLSDKKVSMFVMTEDEERLIEILKTQGKTEQNKIAGLTGYSKPRVSRMLQSLEKRGIIEREKFKKTFRIKIKPKIS